MTRRQLKIAYAMALAVWGAAVLIWFALNQLRVGPYDPAIHSPVGTRLNLGTRPFDCEAPLTLIF